MNKSINDGTTNLTPSFVFFAKGVFAADNVGFALAD